MSTSKPTPTGAKAMQPAPILLDKFHGRQSTPDSEALVSSDDEIDRSDHQHAAASQKPKPRASWLNDPISTNFPPRKGSFASSSMSPTTSHPSTPSAESGNWGTLSQSGLGSGRNLNSTSSFPWGSGIWNNDSRKEPPSRMTEILPSPTSVYPPGSKSTSFFGESQSQRDQTANTTIPFAIPLHPTPKTYRSQSYSVGQLDPESGASILSNATAAAFGGRGRGVPHSGLQHRPSRPSMLSEMSNEGSLGKLREVDDDDDEGTFSDPSHSSQVQSSEAKTIELLSRENALLRQQQFQNSRVRPRSSTSTSGYHLGNHYGLQEPVPEEGEYAIDELDEMNESQDAPNSLAAGRRMSEFGLGQRLSPYLSIENRKLENIKKAYWQSSLGFGGLTDVPQSRRHSFADTVPRQGSVASVGEPQHSHESSLKENLSTGRYQDGPNLDHASSYFGGPSSLARNVDPYSTYSPTFSAYGGSAPYSGRPSSPHRNMYNVPQPRHTQLLYIVLFKCSRADVFYVQEGTGLSVKPGDLVIVEADRGTDLGTVARDNVDWASAKELKEHYAEEHYKWLMMYSQGATGNPDGTGAGLMAASNGLQGSAVGGMGPPTQHGMQESNPGEIKPKIIKRVAQNHEIQALRDKEGNEAKAKRVCMQKVKEHGLHMEILDAEFQMDWKKLTFYYFADAYINFNSLVTDLFKVYKTRIWMSAINPASFASPSLGLQAPSGIGPGAIGASRPSQGERRLPVEQTAYGPSMVARGTYNSSFNQSMNSGLDRQPVAPSAFQNSASPYGNLQFPPTNTRNMASSTGGYTTGMIDPFGAFTAGNDYPGATARLSSSLSSTTKHNNDFGRPPSELGSPNPNWVSNFQSLSLNTR